jgi:hypothetical protein
MSEDKKTAPKETLAQYKARVQKNRASRQGGTLSPYTAGLDSSFQYAWVSDDPQHPANVANALDDGYEYAKGADVTRTKGLVDAMPTPTGAHTVVPDKTSGHNLVLMRLPRDKYKILREIEEEKIINTSKQTKRDLGSISSREGAEFKDIIE